MVFPVHIQFNDRTGGIDFFKISQQQAQHTALDGDLMGVSDGMAEWEPEKEGSRQAQLFGDVFCKTYGYGCYANRLNGSLDQSHGLITKASGWSQYDDVYIVRF